MPAKAVGTGTREAFWRAFGEAAEEKKMRRHAEGSCAMVMRLQDIQGAGSGFRNFINTAVKYIL